ncbi:hypothetical protein GCM10018793_17330 [Streptomyces sulfonofaciens]|uniref:Uncharacterized protein n=1 Tax=Streptomyces sulfonofaciens TaxID=68272 RepID=A0A919G0K8_9ACTN|nr:hypothetical protein [Streptomyces sulfonofaciens]GHH75030.1 hypothetical protein GCM10018793_17330 [Streptomyces sulfonofaciens]
MRRVNLRKTPIRPGARRTNDEADEPGQERPEVRRDILRTWWPDSEVPGGPVRGTGHR